MINATSNRPGVFLENAVFYLSFLLLAIVAGGFFYVRHLTGQSNIEIAALEDQSAKMKTEQEKNLEASVDLARRRLADFSTVISARQSAARVFTEFENLVLPGVYFSKISLDFSGSSLSLSGQGKSFIDVGRQVMKFESAKGILKSVSFPVIAAGDEGGVRFEANTILHSQE
jgi:Tfp pilus assembly protein PilN